MFNFNWNDYVDINFYEDAFISSSTEVEYNTLIDRSITDNSITSTAVMDNTYNYVDNTYITNTMDMDSFMEEIDGILEAVAEGAWWYFF